jgi:hypothetical protein
VPMPPAVTTQPCSQWQPPWALCNLMRQTLESAWAPSMRNGHQNAMECYQWFCNQYNVPIAKQFLTLEAVLCAFAVHRAGHMARATVQNDIATLWAYRIINGLLWLAPLHLKHTMTSIEQACPDLLHQALQPLVTLTLLWAIYNATDPRCSIDTAVLACACASFFGQL